jgi:hypothetical protein
VCDRIGFKSWNNEVVTGFSTETQLRQEETRPVYFSANFWFARDYAMNVGGETVHNALALCEGALRFLSERGDILTVENDIRTIHSELQTITRNSRPVVYAVRIDEGWIKPGNALRRRQFGEFVQAPINLSCWTSIPLERILAKATYVNGAESGFLSLQPACWSDARAICGFISPA